MPSTIPPSPLLARLTPAERAILLDRAVARRLNSGDFVHLAGDSNPRVHLVTSGIVKISARDSEGRETILGLAVAGDLIGDAAAIEGVPHLTDAVAATPCDLLGLDPELLVRVLQANPMAALEVARTFASRLRWLGNTALERTCSAAPARLAGRLLDLAEILGRAADGVVEYELPLPQTDLGRLAGISRETTCKALRYLKQQGILDYRSGRLRILRPEVLERVRQVGFAARDESAPEIGYENGSRSAPRFPKT